MRPAGPGRARPGRAGRPGRTAAGQAARHGTAAATPAQPAAAWSAARTSFILLVLALLGGGLVCLLVINTTLAASSFDITNLQQGNAAISQRVQELQQRLAQQESPATIGQLASRLGMRQQQVLSFLNVRTGRITTQPRTLPGIPAVPGYTP